MTDPFAPIGGGGSSLPPGGGDAAPGGGGEWLPILPVPVGAPEPPKGHPRHGKPAASWTYRDAAGAVLGHVCRFNKPDGGKDVIPLTYCRHTGTGKTEWRWKGWEKPRPLYGLDRLAARPGVPVIITEGEKAADAGGILAPDYVAMTSPNGGKAASLADWSPLAGRVVVVWPDADPPGLAYAETVCKALAGIAASVAIIALPPDLPPGWDAADALADGWTPTDTRLAALLASAVSADAGDAKSERKGRPRRDDLIKMVVESGAVFWTDSASSEPWASVPVGDHIEHHPLAGGAFQSWLAMLLYDQTGAAPGQQMVMDTVAVLRVLSAKGETHRAWLRVGEADGALWLDLGDAAWRAVRIDATGWRVEAQPAARFGRPATLRALPDPEAGGDPADLRGLLNCATDDDFILVLAWLVAALRPTPPYPILILQGAQGSGKSGAMRILRGLIDQARPIMCSMPQKENDLIAVAANNWVIAFDNMSAITGDTSDNLCRLSTGGGFMVRKLHTNTDIAAWDGARPMILNGITDLAGRPDLADRAIVVRMASIPDDQRRTEAEIEAALTQAAPALLGSLLDGVAAALRDRGKVVLPCKPRMADFALWATAAEAGLGWEPGTFMQTYAQNRREGLDVLAENDSVVQAIAALVRDQDWAGTATGLLERLNNLASESIKRGRAWPATPKAIRSHLGRVIDVLRHLGITVELDRRSPDRVRNRLIGLSMPHRGA